MFTLEGIHGRVPMDTLEWPLIKTWLTSRSTSQLILSRHSFNSSINACPDWHLINSRLSVNWLIWLHRLPLTGMFAKISQLSTEILILWWSSIKMEVSIECPWNINQQSTIEVAFSTHDPALRNQEYLKEITSAWKYIYLIKGLVIQG